MTEELTPNITVNRNALWAALKWLKSTIKGHKYPYTVVRASLGPWVEQGEPRNLALMVVTRKGMGARVLLPSTGEPAVGHFDVWLDLGTLKSSVLKGSAQSTAAIHVGSGTNVSVEGGEPRPRYQDVIQDPRAADVRAFNAATLGVICGQGILSPEPSFSAAVGFRAVLPFVSKDPYRPNMLGVNVQTVAGEESHYLTATDGHRLGQEIVPGMRGFGLVSTEFAEAVAACPVKLGIVVSGKGDEPHGGGNHRAEASARSKGDTYTLYAPLFPDDKPDGRYPITQQVIPHAESPAFGLDAADISGLKGMLKGLKGPRIQLRLSGETLVVTLRSNLRPEEAKKGVLYPDVALEKKVKIFGGPWEPIWLNPQYLLDVMHPKGQLTIFQCAGERAPVLITTDLNSGSRRVVMPLRE